MRLTAVGPHYIDLWTGGNSSEDIDKKKAVKKAESAKVLDDFLTHKTTHKVREIYLRLQEYEDCGLSPKEVRALDLNSQTDWN